MARKVLTKREQVEVARRELARAKGFVKRWTTRLRTGTTKLRAWSKRVERWEAKLAELSAPPAPAPSTTRRRILHEEA